MGYGVRFRLKGRFNWQRKVGRGIPGSVRVIGGFCLNWRFGREVAFHSGRIFRRSGGAVQGGGVGLEWRLNRLGWAEKGRGVQFKGWFNWSGWAEKGWRVQFKGRFNRFGWAEKGWGVQFKGRLYRLGWAEKGWSVQFIGGFWCFDRDDLGRGVEIRDWFNWFGRADRGRLFHLGRRGWRQADQGFHTAKPQALPGLQRPGLAVVQADTIHPGSMGRIQIFDHNLPLLQAQAGMKA